MHAAGKPNTIPMDLILRAGAGTMDVSGEPT